MATESDQFNADEMDSSKASPNSKSTEQLEREKQEEGQQQRQLRERYKKQTRQTKSALKQLLVGNAFRSEDSELLLSKISVEDSQLIVNACENIQNRSIDPESIRTEVNKILAQQLKDIKSQLEAEAEEAAERQHKLDLLTKGKQRHSVNSSNPPWTYVEQSLLAKAMQKFVPGTSERWQKITNFVNTNKEDQSYSMTLKEVTQRGRALDSVGTKIDGAQAFETFLKSQKRSQPQVQSTSEFASKNATDENNSSVTDWTAEQQGELETALASIPRDSPNRWDKIAEKVTNKSKEDCIARFKFIKHQIQNSKQG